MVYKTTYIVIISEFAQIIVFRIRIYEVQSGLLTRGKVNVSVTFVKLRRRPDQIPE